MSHEITPAAKQSLYALGWASAPGGMFAFEKASGKIIDANPAAEEMSGYSRDQLIGLHITMLHPEAEREQVKAQFLNGTLKPLFYLSFHIQHQDGQCAPVNIKSSYPITLGDRQVMICVYRNTSDLELSEHHLTTKTWALSAFAGAALALTHEHSAASLFKAICEAITRESIYTLAFVGIAENGPDKRVDIAAATGAAVSFLDGQNLSWSEDRPDENGPIGLSIRSNQAQFLENCVEHPAFEPFREQARRFGIQSCMSVPFSAQGQMRGALVVYAEHPHAFGQVAVEVFQNLADQIGRAIHAIEQKQHLLDEQGHTAKLQSQLTEALSAMVLPIVTAMEMRDPFTSGHQARVAEIAVAIARELGWQEERIGGLRVAATVHDVGKISVPVEILTKSGPLTGVERMMIDAHSETGHTILKGIPFLWPVAEIVRQHHEKLDGSGYPYGLKGDQILPETRILTVADMADAMVSDRPYRRAFDLEKTLAIMEEEAGTKLDAEAVRVCAALFREKRLVIPLGKQYIR